MTSSSQFLLFSIVGGFSALVNVLARALLNVAVSFEVAVVLAFPVALTTAFVLNRHVVFGAVDGNVASQYGRFFLINIIALVQVFVISVGLARVVFPWTGFHWHAETVAHVIGVLSPILSSYLLHRNFTFGSALRESSTKGEGSFRGMPPHP